MHVSCDLPVLQFLAVDADGPLGVLGDTHFVPATFHLLTWVLGCVYICWEIKLKLNY